MDALARRVFMQQQSSPQQERYGDYVSPSSTNDNVLVEATGKSDMLHQPLTPQLHVDEITTDSHEYWPTLLSGPADIAVHTDDQTLVDLFYAYFHPAHPILVPRKLYFERKYPNYLRMVVQFIGSHYSTSAQRDILRDMTAVAVTDDSKQTACMVKARLLFAIVLYARNEVKEAQNTLRRAIQLALEIGINHQECFSVRGVHGRQKLVEEESLRRTWWELYIVDSFMAALLSKSTFRTNGVATDMQLPCEESVYADGTHFPEPQSLIDFDRRLLLEEELQFSSFSYRIDAARILARVLEVASSQEIPRDRIQAVDNALAAWLYALQPGKTEIVNVYGESDEMLFQAHMIIHYATVVLHYRRSDLVSALTTKMGMNIPPASTQQTYGVKALQASKQLSDLLGLRLPPLRHTPFFICSLALSANVQLAAYTLHWRHRPGFLRDNITLIIAVFKFLSHTWALSQIVLQQVKKVAAQALDYSSQVSVVHPSSARAGGADESYADIPTSMEMAQRDSTWINMIDHDTMLSLVQPSTDLSYYTPT